MNMNVGYDKILKQKVLILNLGLMGILMSCVLIAVAAAQVTEGTTIPEAVTNTLVPPTVSPTDSTPRIDVLDLKDVDIGDVLKLISQKSGINIAAGNNVTGKVSLYLKDVEAKEALKIIAQTNDLAFVESPGLIRVMTGTDFEKMYGYKFLRNTKKIITKLNYVNVAEVTPMLERMKSPEGVIITDDHSNIIVLNDLVEKLLDMQSFLLQVDQPRVTEIFELIYAKAEEIVEKINPILTPNVGSLRFDKRTNKISVTDIQPKINDIRRVIQAFDVKETQVAIEAKIVQVILSDQFKMGINWQAIVSDYHNLTLGNTFDVLGATDKKGQVSIGTLSTDNYSAMVEALDQFGTTNNLSNPHIIAINNQEAKILVGSTEPYVTSTTTTPASGPTTTAESVNFIEVGVKLYVTPTIHKDGYVTMKIKPEVSSVTRNLTTSNNNTIPVVETSEAETTVLVKDGVTIVIGGLIKDEKINTDKRVPILGSVPVLGAAFRSKDHLVRKTELVIFLTPRIIAGDTPANVKKIMQIKLPHNY